MQFTIPSFQRKCDPAGTYKIWFNEKWFYIGSSKKLRSRFRTWRSMMNKPQYLKNKNIYHLLSEITTVRFEILHVYSNDKLLKKAETKLLKKSWNDPLLLNRCPDASTPKNIRPYNGQVVKPKRARRPKDSFKKKVAVFDLNWNYIETAESLNAAARSLGVQHRRISEMLKGKKTSVKGKRFKLVASDGSFIDPIPKIKKKPKVRGNIKPVAQCDLSGNLIAVHVSTGEAAKALNINRRNIQHVIKGDKRLKTYKGFIWRYFNV